MPLAYTAIQSHLSHTIVTLLSYCIYIFSVRCKYMRLSQLTLRFTFPLIIGLVGLVFSSLSAAQKPHTLNIYGSNTIGSQLAPALAQSFLEHRGLTRIKRQSDANTQQHSFTAGTQAEPTSLQIHIHSQGSSTGFTALHHGNGDIAAASRPIKTQEAHQLSTLGDMRSSHAEHVIAIDGIAIIVHPDNPVATLDLTELAAVFSGEISNWESLGGNPGQINLYARDNKSGTWETFKELVLTPAEHSLANSAKRFESSYALSESVSQDPNGIGFIGLPYVLNAKALAISAGGALPMFPTAGLIATEDYPLSRRLYLYSAEHNSNPLAQAFLDFTHSAAGQKQVENNGFISQEVSAMSVASVVDMPPRYQELAQHAQRLSVNFRFKEGSAQLDNKAARDIDRVLAYLRNNNKTDKKLVLVGFGDEKSDPERALLLSKLRAMAVRRELRQPDITFKEVLGIGDVMPVASNKADHGRLKNRRVELWVY